MFARVVNVKVKKDSIEEAIELYRQNIVPKAESMEGFEGIYLLVDRETGSGMSISVWSAEKGAEADRQGAMFGEEIEKFGDLVKASPVQEVFEIAIAST